MQRSLFFFVAILAVVCVILMVHQQRNYLLSNRADRSHFSAELSFLQEEIGQLRNQLRHLKSIKNGTTTEYGRDETSKVLSEQRVRRRAVAVFFECCTRKGYHTRPATLNELGGLHSSWEWVTGRVWSPDVYPEQARKRKSLRNAYPWLAEVWEVADEIEFGGESLFKRHTVQIDFLIFTNNASVSHIPDSWKCVRFPAPPIDANEANCIVIVEHTGWSEVVDDDVPDFKGSPFIRRRLAEKLRRRDSQDQSQLDFDAHLDTYRFTRSLEFFQWPEARILDGYDLVLKTDLDTYLTPKFANWWPEGFAICSSSPSAAYGGMFYTVDRLRKIADSLGLVHRGVSGIGLTWYGPGAQVRRIGALATDLTVYLHATQFTSSDPHEWSKWWRGVASMYGSELAINHLAPNMNLLPKDIIDVSAEDFAGPSILTAAHIHTYQIYQFFSKEGFHRGQYDNVSVDGWDNRLPAVWALQHSQRGTGLRSRFEHMHILPYTVKELWPHMRFPDLEKLKPVL